MADENTLTLETITLNLVVRDEDFVGLFDQIEVWRSRTTIAGPFEEVTARIWTGARLPKDGGDLPSPPVVGPDVNIATLLLEFKLKEQDLVQVVFTGSDPLTFTEVANQIAAQSLGRLRSYVDLEEHLVVETTEPGSGAVLRVLPSDAAAFLALPLAEPDSIGFGHTARIQLVAGKGAYEFVDAAGSTSYFYKTRFRNSHTGALSEFSVPFEVKGTSGVAAAALVLGFLDLVGNDGLALSGRDVSIRCLFTGNVIDGRVVAGNDLVKKTDAKGHVEFSLVRGQKYTVAIVGTNLIKEFTAPTDPAVASFLLLDIAYSEQDDYFKVRVPELPMLDRRSF